MVVLTALWRPVVILVLLILHITMVSWCTSWCTYAGTYSDDQSRFCCYNISQITLVSWCISWCTWYLLSCDVLVVILTALWCPVVILVYLLWYPVGKLMYLWRYLLPCDVLWYCGTRVASWYTCDDTYCHVLWSFWCTYITCYCGTLVASWCTCDDTYSPVMSCVFFLVLLILHITVVPWWQADVLVMMLTAMWCPVVILALLMLHVTVVSWWQEDVLVMILTAVWCPVVILVLLT